MSSLRLTAFAWGVALLTALVWAATTFIAERTVPTLLLTYFVLPQVWVLLALVTLLVCVWKRSGPAILGGGAAPPPSGRSGQTWCACRKSTA